MNKKVYRVQFLGYARAYYPARFRAVHVLSFDFPLHSLGIPWRPKSGRNSGLSAICSGLVSHSTQWEHKTHYAAGMQDVLRELSLNIANLNEGV